MTLKAGMVKHQTRTTHDLYSLFLESPREKLNFEIPKDKFCKLVVSLLYL